MKNTIILIKENTKVKYFNTNPEDTMNNNLLMAPPPKLNGVKL